MMHSLMFETPVPFGGGAAKSINLSTWNFIYILSILNAVTPSGIVFGMQKLSITFNFSSQDFIVFTKDLKLAMCRASEADS